MFIFIHKNHNNNTYGVYDTDDNTLEYITEQELVSLIRHNVKIEGVMRGKNGYCFRINKDMLVVYKGRQANNTLYSIFLNNPCGRYFLGEFNIISKGENSEVSFENFNSMGSEYKAEAYKVAIEFINKSLSGSVKIYVPFSDVVLFNNYQLRSGFYAKPI